MKLLLQLVTYIILSAVYYIPYTEAKLIVIDTPYRGDYSANAGDNFLIESSVGGRLIIGASGSDITIRSGGTVLKSITIAGGISSINIDQGGRVGDGIRIAGGNATLNIEGVVDNGIILGNGINNIVVSGILSEVGTITGTTNSIIGGNSQDTVVLENSTINNTINLLDGENSVTIDAGRASSIYTGTGKDIFSIIGGSSLVGDIETGGGGDSISIFDSSITGSLHTQNTGSIGNDTVRLIAGYIQGSIESGGGFDTISLEESSNVGGNILALGSASMRSTFGSSVLGNITINKALTLEAPSGIIVHGITRSHDNSTYNVVRSEFKSAIELYGITNFIGADTAIQDSIVLKKVGALDISLTNSRVKNIIDASINTENTTVHITNTVVPTVLFGTGFNIFRTTNSTVYTFRANNLTLESVGSTFTTDINIATRLEASILNSIVKGNISTGNGLFTNNISINGTRVEGSMSLGGTVVLNIAQQSSIIGTITTNDKNDSITVQNSMLESVMLLGGDDIYTMNGGYLKMLDTGLGNDTLRFANATVDTISVTGGSNTLVIDGSTIGSIVTPVGGLDINTVTFTNRSLYAGSLLDIATGNIIVDGSLVLYKPENATTDLDTTIRVSTLDITNNGLFELNKNNLASRLILDVQTLHNVQKSAVTKLYVDIRGGKGTVLDVSKVVNYSGEQYTVAFAGVQGKGVLVDRIEGLIIANPGIIPKLERKYAIISGNLYTLEESTAIDNTYDLVNQGESPTNYGYAAAHTAIRSYNTTIWRSLLSHFQEELQMEREKDGRKRAGGSILDTVSVWARGSYAISKTSPFNAPALHENISTALAGVDFANISIAKDTTVMFQIFAGFGSVWSDFTNLPQQDIHFSTNQTGLTVGGSFGIENITHQGLGKIFFTVSSWYTTILSDISSNIFMENNSWTNGSINGSVSFGYSAYVNGTIITPQLDLVYFHTFSKKYMSPDINEIYLNKDERLLGRASILLGQSTHVGLTPYVRSGIEIPLFISESSGYARVGDSTEKYSYTTNSFSTDVGVGLSYRGGVKGFEVTFSAEVNAYFGAKEGIETFVQLGFVF